MPQENEMPTEWVKTLSEAIASTIEFRGPASLEWFYSALDENGSGVDLIELFPAVMEIEEAGPYDGETVFGLVHNIDILEAQKAFDEVSDVSFSVEDDGRPILSIGGKYKGRDVVVLIYFEPSLDDDDATE